MLYAGFVMFVGLGAVNSQNNLLFLLLGFAVGGLVVSGVLSGSMMMRVGVRRRSIAAGRVGDPMHIEYVIENRSWLLPAFALTIEESEERRRGSDGRRAWAKATDRPRTYAEYIGRRGARCVRADFTPVKRGEYALRDVRISSAFPFGLVEKTAEFQADTTFLVYPARVALKRGVVGRLMSSTAHAGSAARTRGPGEEFHGLHEYTPGDSPRLIAWRASARTGELVVKEQSWSSARRVWVWLDLPQHPAAHRSEEIEAAEEAAIALAGTLLEESNRAGVQAGLVVPSHGISHKPAVGARHRVAMLESLARLDLQRPSPANGETQRSLPSARDAVVVVHGCPVEPGVGPPGAMHLSSADAIASPSRSIASETAPVRERAT